MIVKFRPVLFFVFSLLFAALPAICQTGGIQGTVVDQSGGAIPQAKVSAFDEAKGIVVREAVTSSEGFFQLLPLLDATYTVRVERDGFKTLERKGLVLDPNQLMNLGNLTLPVGDTTTSVTVEAQVPLVEDATFDKSYVVTAQQINELSLNGRDFGSLILTLPGVLAASDAQSDFRMSFNLTTGFNVNGQRTSMNNVAFDGSPNLDVGDNGSQYTQPSLDAIGEFKVKTSAFAAEHGRNSGVMISATTKAGGKQYHGTLYEFLRNDAMDARLPFDTTGLKTKLRFNQFGGNIGGPLVIPGLTSRINKKAFFFFNHESTRGIRPQGNQYVDVPSSALLDGNFQSAWTSGNISGTQFRNGTVFVPGTLSFSNSGNITNGVPFADNIIPKVYWSKNAPAFLKVLNSLDRSKATPTPNAPQQVRVPMRETYQLKKDSELLRADWNLNPRNNLFFRWADDKQWERDAFGIWTKAPFPVYPQMHKKPGSSWSWNSVNMIGRNVISEFIFAYTHQSQKVDVAEDLDPATYDRDKLGFTYTQLFPNSNVRNRFPRFNCGVGSCNLQGFSSNWLNDGKDYTWTENATLIRKSHTYKFGLMFNLDDKQQQPSWNDAGTFDFTASSTNVNPNGTNNNLGNLLTGYYTSAQQANGIFYGDFRFIGWEWYAQDSWKLWRRFTLEYGIRYSYFGPTYTRHKFLMNYFDPTRYDPAQAVRLQTADGLTKGSIVPGSGNPFNGMVEENSTGIINGFGKHHKNQYAPRVGFAWSPFRQGKMALRGGFGIFFERMRQNVNSFDALGNPPLTYTPLVYSGNIDTMSSALVASGTRFPVSVTAFNKDYFTPTVYSWQFGIQKELPKKTSIDVAYVGNTGRHLQYRMDLNQLPLATTTSTTILAANNNVNNAVRPYKGYSNVNYTDYGANSNYHALQARVSRRFSSIFTANANFTWAKTLDCVDTDNAPIQYYQDRKREWGPAGFDRTRVLNVDYVYYLPKFGTRLTHWAPARKLLDGWQFSGITRFWDGMPLTINNSSANSGTLSGTVRANYLGGQVYPDKKTRNEYFNPLVFGRPFDGQWGNTGKGILRGPGVNNWDFSLFKNTKIGERYSLQFRLETFNVLNHTQWWGVNTSVGGSNPGSPITQSTRGTSGQVSSTRDPRNIQLSMKLYF
jgi:hypothetical protein